MDLAYQEISEFIDLYYSKNLKVINIAGGGSGRKYYRLTTEKGSVMICYNQNISENISFFSIADKLRLVMGDAVPEIMKINSSNTVYSQSDFGDLSLLNLQEKKPTEAEKIYTQVVTDLTKIQNHAKKLLETIDFFDSPRFDKMLVYRDLFYFKDYYLDFSSIPYSQYRLLNDFEKLAEKFTTISSSQELFLYRDFQARNILVHQEKPRYIDFQAAMLGPCSYDLVSLLWQAKANLSDEQKSSLKLKYICSMKEINPDFSDSEFEESYQASLIIRLLQVLGAYGKIGKIQGKNHFIQSIELGEQNLIEIFENGLLKPFPELMKIVEYLKNKNI